MERIEGIEEMREWTKKRRKEGRRIGFVPTMGYLHDGHLNLVEEAKRVTETVVVSIYVNPTQFGPGEDYEVYPRDVSGDVEKLKSRQVDCVFLPKTLYAIGKDKPGDGETCLCSRKNLSDRLCGKSRPHFFGGVCTVLVKLFHIVQPDVAVFGKKDYQQWKVVQAMVEDLHMDVQVLGCPLVRDVDGLAMSSRNARLDTSQREAALSISKSLFDAKKRASEGETNVRVLVQSIRRTIEESGGRIDYVEIVDANSLETLERIDEKPSLIAVAVHYGSVRLIDNMEMSMRCNHGRS